VGGTGQLTLGVGKTEPYQDAFQREVSCKRLQQWGGMIHKLGAEAAPGGEQGAVIPYSKDKTFREKTEFRSPMFKVWLGGGNRGPGKRSNKVQKGKKKLQKASKWRSFPGERGGSGELGMRIFSTKKKEKGKWA